MLLFGNDSNKKANLNDVEKATAEIKIEPDIINWAEVLVGDTKSQEISITASADVNVLAVNNYTKIKFENQLKKFLQIYLQLLNQFLYIEPEFQK